MSNVLETVLPAYEVKNLHVATLSLVVTTIPENCRTCLDLPGATTFSTDALDERRINGRWQVVHRPAVLRTNYSGAIDGALDVIDEEL